MRNGADVVLNWTLAPMARLISLNFAVWLDGQDPELNPEVKVIQAEVCIPDMVLYLRQRKITNPSQFANLLLGSLRYSKHSYLSQFTKNSLVARRMV